MKLRLYALKSALPNGVSAGTGFPVGPLPVNEELKVGATVKVDVHALSMVELTPAPVALRQMMLTVFLVWSLGELVWPKR